MSVCTTVMMSVFLSLVKMERMLSSLLIPLWMAVLPYEVYSQGG